jgi:hypothetical protein
LSILIPYNKERKRIEREDKEFGVPRAHVDEAGTVQAVANHKRGAPFPPRIRQATAA